MCFGLSGRWPSNASLKLGQQPLPVPRQVPCQGKGVGGVVGAKDHRLRWIQPADQPHLLSQDGGIIGHYKGFAKFGPELGQYAFIEIEL